MQNNITTIEGGFDRLNLYHVQWHLGNYCNYRCSYCNDALRDGSFKFVPIDIAKKVVTSLADQTEHTKKRVSYTFSGGEPTVYKEFEELLEFIYERGGYSHMISNASRSVAYYKKIAKFLTHGVILTYHSEYAKIDQFIKIANLFKRSLLTVYLPMNTAKWQECVDSYNTLKNAGIRVIPKTVFEDFGNGGKNTITLYTKAQRNFIDQESRVALTPFIDHKNVIQPLMLTPKAYPKSKHSYRVIEIKYDDGTSKLTSPQELIINRQNDFRGMKCNAGIDFLLIGYDGSVFKANCQNEIIGNIYKNAEIEIPKEPIICNIASCWCEGDLLINKFK